MKLNLEALKEDIKNVKTPNYNVQKVIKHTNKKPMWIHFGAGNIFRGYIARLQDDLLNLNLSKSGIIACDTFDDEVISKIYKPYDNQILLATMSANEPNKYQIVSSVTDAMYIDLQNPSVLAKVEKIMNSKSLQMLSFTITEKGYQLIDINGNYLPIIQDDIKNGPTKPKHVMSIVTSLLYKRYLAKKQKLAVVSMDNCSHNGEKLEKAIKTIANAWLDLGFVPKDFIDYISNEEYVSFPWSMIDKITPRPSQNVKEELEKLGFEGIEPITSSRNTYIAPYVNAEKAEYLVIEDKFPNGRPQLEKVGVYFTDRNTVNNVETMKVTTCLNPLHTALAVYGCLLGYKTISSEMESKELVSLIKGVASEGMKVVVDPKIISPTSFLNEVLNERFPNKSIVDVPERIATDTSQKIPVRFGETIKSYVNKNLNLDELKYIPLVIAGWCRYLLGFNDNMEKMQLSSDPMLDTLTKLLETVKIDSNQYKYNGELKSILSNDKIFGIDLYTTPLAKKVEDMFISMIKGEGSVLSTLKKYI